MGLEKDLPIRRMTDTDLPEIGCSKVARSVGKGDSFRRSDECPRQHAKSTAEYTRL